MASKKTDLIPFQRWFGNYCRAFMTTSQEDHRPLGTKVVHCQRVRQEMLRLGQAIELTPPLLFLAEITGLFHDIGRFEQYQQYHTFVDLHSINHAQRSVEILSRAKVLAPLDPEAQEWILLAISNHNKAAITSDLPETANLLARMIRDADKLDIWRVFIDFCQQPTKLRSTAIVLGLPDSPGISQGAFTDIMAGRLVSGNHLTNQNDFAVMRLSWVFDLNFQDSHREIIKRNYLPQQFSILPPSQQSKAIMAKVENHVNSQANR